MDFLSEILLWAMRAVRIVPLIFLALKWLVAILLFNTSEYIQAFGGGVFSSSLGGAAANSWWYIIPAAIIDALVLQDLIYEPDLRVNSNRDGVAGISVIYFIFNLYASFHATYGSATTVGRYSQDAGMLLSLILTSPVAVVVTTMTFWLPVWLYLTLKYTEPLEDLWF